MPSSPPRRALTVLQVIPALDTGGAERATIDIAAALAARGDRALVASEGGRLEAELNAAGGELLRLPVGSKNPLTLAANAIRLAKIIRRENVDIVHARSRAPAWSVLAACRLTGARFVTTYHGIYAEEGALKRFYNSVMVRGAVIANSRYTADLIRRRYGTPAERISVIPRGIDLKHFDPAAVDPARREALRRAWGLGGEKVALNVARLTGWKGQGVLIEAAALPPLADRGDVVFVLAGDEQGRGGYRAELQRMIEARGLKGRVRLVGHCDDVAAAYALADVVVVASTEPEAFGRAAIEAAAMGVPVVATALGASPETVLAPPKVSSDQRTGWLVPPRDPGSTSAAISAALALLRGMREALDRRARTHAGTFTVEAMQRATLSLYDRLVSPSCDSATILKR
jgi:glycosyltransferase involved in cell wall biosynthesis